MKLRRHVALSDQNDTLCAKLEYEGSSLSFTVFARIDMSRHSVNYLGLAVIL
jgi:hypothetical protein